MQPPSPFNEQVCVASWPGYRIARDLYCGTPEVAGDRGDRPMQAESDLHSHGLHGAFWSAEDDRDDNGVRVCGVFGNLDRAMPTARFRLVLNGHFVTLPNPWNSEGSERA